MKLAGFGTVEDAVCGWTYRKQSSLYGEKFNIALNCVIEIWKKRSFISVSIKWDNGTSGWRVRECWGQMMCRLLFNDISMMTLNVLLCHYSLGRHRLLNRTIYRLRQMSFYSPDPFIENANEHKTFARARNCSSSITRMFGEMAAYEVKLIHLWPGNDNKL